MSGDLEALARIRERRGVEAHLEHRVRYSYPGREPVLGTIVGADSDYIMVCLDGEVLARAYHPTWQIEYLGPREMSDGDC